EKALLCLLLAGEIAAEEGPQRGVGLDAVVEAIDERVDRRRPAGAREHVAAVEGAVRIGTRQEAAMVQGPHGRVTECSTLDRMAQTTVHVRTVEGMSTAVGWAGERTLTIDRPQAAGGHGLGFNGGELLLLAIGGCVSNDLYREAAKRSIRITAVNVAVTCDWGGEPVRAQNVSYSVTVEADASRADILALIEHTDAIAEIPSSLRHGADVTLGARTAIPGQRERIEM